MPLDKSLYDILQPKAKKTSKKSINSKKWSDSDDDDVILISKVSKAKNIPKSKNEDDLIFMGKTDNHRTTNFATPVAGNSYAVKAPIKTSFSTAPTSNQVTKKLDDLFFKKPDPPPVVETPRPYRQRRPRQNPRPGYYAYDNLQNFNIVDIFFADPQQVFNVFQQRRANTTPNSTSRVSEARFNQLPSWKYFSGAAVVPRGDGAADPDEAKSCAICLDEYRVNDPMVTLPCMHFFHRDCVKRWFQNQPNCPTCRCDIGS